MVKYSRTPFILFATAFSFLFLAIVLFSAAQASELQEDGGDIFVPYTLDGSGVVQHALLIDSWQMSRAANQDGDEVALAPAVEPTTPTLTIANISTIWAPLDNNKPGLEGPNVFIVEAVVTNTGLSTADRVRLTLDYNEDPDNDWVLLPGEDQLRTTESLAYGEAFYAYWFVSYPTVHDATHQYTVTATAENADPVATSDNYYGNPEAGKTVKTRSYNDTGNNSQIQASANVIVGLSFSITVGFDWVQDPIELVLSPVGNIDFDVTSAKLVSSTTSFFDDDDATQELVFENQLYYQTMPLLPNGTAPDRASTTYYFLALRPAETRLCAYNGVDTGNNEWYDNNYCNLETEILISGTSSFSITKTASDDTFQQGDLLTYTLAYTNNGDVELQYVWIWDEIEPNEGTIVARTSDPSPDIDEDHLVAWFLDTVPADGSGVLTLTVQIDGDGLNLADDTSIVNNAFYGINVGSLPAAAAMTSTVTGTLQAPMVSIAKTDDLDYIGVGEPITYTIIVSNTGSVPAIGLIITDVLPLDVSLAGAPSPVPDNSAGNILEWHSATLGDLEPNGGTLTITIPVTVGQDVATGSILTNTARVEYLNTAGHTFQIGTAEDTTVVFRDAGFVDGYAFVDQNGDGLMSGGESGLPGVTVQLPAALNPITATDSTGYYRFRIESEGPVSVTSGMEAGYFRTTPGTVYINSQLGVTQTVNFGYALNDSQFGVLFGTVFEDINRDGVQGIGENGLVGVTLTSTEALTSTILTNQYGGYTFKYVASGVATVTEENPQGYVSTTPDILAANVSLGSSNSSPLNFGDYPGIKVTGMVFDDANVNGSKDAEAGLAGAIISAGGESFNTGSSGVYTLYLSVNGDPILVTETDPADYVSTNAVAGLGMSRIDANTLRIDNPVAGTSYGGSYFGDVLASVAVTVTGKVFSDTNVNGAYDSEPGLAGAVVSLSSGITETTGPDGTYVLLAPPGQVITVTETNPAGYVSTNAVPGSDSAKVDNDTLTVSALAGGSTSSGNLFGDVRLNEVVAISGYVWNDNGADGGTAGDGIWDPGEPALAGASLDLSSGMSQTTVADGAFLLYAPAGVAITVTETNPPNYGSTGAVAGNNATVLDKDRLLVDGLTGGESSVGNLFGDAILADVAITKKVEPDPVAAGGMLTYTLVYTNYGPSDGHEMLITDTLDSKLIFGGVVSENPPMDNFSQLGQSITWEIANITAGASGVIVYTATVHPASTGTVVNSAQINTTTPDNNPDNDADSVQAIIGDPGIATIYGYVFEDTNGDGHQDSGEDGISGVSVTLDGAITTTTDADGLYYFLTVKSGVHTVVETQPNGYFSTTPNEVHPNVVLGESQRVDFGEALIDAGFASIHGTVFEDIDSSQTWDPGEIGIEGVTVTLDAITLTTTDLYGTFSFSTTNGGEHVVIETDPDFYFSTTPNTVTVEVVMNNGYTVNFGDVPSGLATCPADEYEEDDVFGQATDLSLSDIQDHDFCDDAVDWLRMTVTAGNVYTFTTSSWGQRSDTYLALFAEDGQTLLLANDDYDGTNDFSSRLVWKATYSGDVFVRVTNRVDLEGFHTDYSVWAEEEPFYTIFIPIISVDHPLSATSGQQVPSGQPALFSMAQVETSFFSPNSPNGPLGVIEHSCPDNYETDDTWQLANVIESGQSQLHSFDSNPEIYAADKDFVSFDLLTTQEITFSVTSTSTTSPSTDAWLELYDSVGNFMGQSGTNFLFVENVPAGQYYLSASPKSTDYGCLEEVGIELLAEKEVIYQVQLPVILK